MAPLSTLFKNGRRPPDRRASVSSNGLPVLRRRQSSVFDPDEKWSNLYREREKNNIYKWVGVRSGGELITVYEKDGEEGVLLFAQEKLEPMMYNNGKFTHTIKFPDYVRWKKTVNTVFGILDDNDFNEVQSKFRDHEAQWRLNKRGVEGETLIHLLLNREEPLCSEIARILINRYPGLAKDIYLGDEMFGQSALHLSIVHDDYDTVQLLLEKGAVVNARASGDFFMPENQDNDHKAMDYQGYAYYGEYPLAFAACFENKDIYDLLIQYGANPDLQDVFGNTCLHMCVINYSNSMYSYAVRHWHKPAHTNIVNHAGFTPLTLATKLGRKQIFEEMLELMKVEFWRFSDMTCSAYPLDTLDTIRPDGSTNYDSALMTVINGSTPEHLEMIGSEVIQRLLADKWKAFASRKLFERLALLVLHLVCLCFVVYLRPTELERLYMDRPLWDDYVRTVFEILTIMSCCWFVFVQQFGELRTQGLYGYIRNLKTVPAKVVFLVANLCLLACVPFRFLRQYQIEESLLVFTLPGSWIFLLFFARSAKLTGPFVQMIYSMIAGDMIRFAIISAIFLVSFSQVFYFVGKDMNKKQLLPRDHPDRCPIEGYAIRTYSSYLETFVTLFRASMGGYDYEEFQCTNYEPLTKTLFVFYMFIMPIMMINILIAMMGNTYTTVITQAEKAWRQQYAQIIMVLERSMNRQRLVTCQLEYSIRLNDPGRETRGLMVIKQTKKTKASQRKQAINNWKHIARKVIVMVRDLGGEHAKFLLHSHDRMIDETVAATAGNVQSASAIAISRSNNRSMSNVASNHSDDGGGGGCSKQQHYADHRASSGGVAATTSANADSMNATAMNSLNAVVIAARYNAIDGHVGGPPPIGPQLNGAPNAMRRSLDSAHGSVTTRAGSAHHQRNGVRHNNAPPPPANGGVAVAVTGRRMQSSGELSINGAGGGPPPNQYLHLTQRPLPAVAGSKVRGVEMLPSVDIPNIPSGVVPTTITSSSLSTAVGTPDHGAAIAARRGGPLNSQPPTGGDVTYRRSISRRKTFVAVAQIRETEGMSASSPPLHSTSAAGAAAPDQLSYSPPPSQIQPKRSPRVRRDTFRKKDSPAAASKSSSSTSKKSTGG